MPGFTTTSPEPVSIKRPRLEAPPMLKSAYQNPYIISKKVTQDSKTYCINFYSLGSQSISSLKVEKSCAFSLGEGEA